VRAHAVAGRVLAGLLVAVGLAMVAATLAAGGGPLATGVLLGTLFAGVGVARLLAAGGAE
jgi:hypothetical protein